MRTGRPRSVVGGRPAAQSAVRPRTGRPRSSAKFRKTRLAPTSVRVPAPERSNFRKISQNFAKHAAPERPPGLQHRSGAERLGETELQCKNEFSQQKRAPAGSVGPPRLAQKGSPKKRGRPEQGPGLPVGAVLRVPGEVQGEGRGRGRDARQLGGQHPHPVAAELGLRDQGYSRLQLVCGLIQLSRMEKSCTQEAEGAGSSVFLQGGLGFLPGQAENGPGPRCSRDKPAPATLPLNVPFRFFFL